MSTKTSIKRIALVAVSALGFGLLSTSPSTAALTGGDAVTMLKLNSFTNAVTTLGGRVNNEISISLTATGSAAAPGANKQLGMTIAAAMTSQPTGSAVNAKLTAADPGGTMDFAAAGLSWDNDQALSGINDTQTPTRAAQLNYSINDANIAYSCDGCTVGTLTFTPTHVGTYTVTVWNDVSALNAAIATVGTAENGDAATLDGSDSFITFTINVAASVSTIKLTPHNATTVEDSSYGSLVKVQILDAAGNAASLATGESVIVTPSGTGLISRRTAGNATTLGTATGISAGSSWALTSAEFGSTGTAWVNVTNAADETITLSARLSSNSNVIASTSLVFTDIEATTATTLEPSALTTGWAGSTDTYTTPLVSSITYRLTNSAIAAGSTSTKYAAFTVEDDLGDITGLVEARYDISVNSVTGATVTIPVTFTAAGETYKIGDSAATNGDTATEYNNCAACNTITAAAVNINAGTINGNITDTVTINRSSLRVAPAGTASFTVTVYNQFGVAMPSTRVIMSWSGRNASTASTQVTGYTDANGIVTLSYTDTAASTVTATADTVTFTANDGTNNSTSTATVNWLATTAGTLTLTSTGDTDTIAGTTKTDISAAATGATGTSATAAALVKDSNGVIIVGTPVTFTVTGLTGAELHTTSATVYTDATGTATAYISSYAAGKATVTATVGTLTASDDIYFSQQTVTEARTIAATVSGSVVTATVKDRYGNTIEGVTVNATRTGTGYFGSGASTATGTTDKNGVVEFIYTGTGTVTVAFSTTTYGQSTSAADKVGTTAVTAYTAGTATVNQKGLGGSLAPAGVNSASVSVASVDAAQAAADAAADAAAEAIDAANAATDAANLAAEAADAATVAAEEARDAADAATAAVEELATQVATLMAALKAQITTLANTVAKIAKKVKA